MSQSESTPPVSIVVPSYNQGQFIGATLDSILEQGIEGIEILVMDGGSKDNTVEVLKSFNSKIQWVSEKDRGQSHAINKGFSRAHSKVLGYINSDDTYQPGALMTVLEVFKNHPQIDIIYGDFNYINAKGKVLANCQTINFDYDILRYDYNFICQPASFWRRSVIERIGPMAEELYYLMDYEFYLRAAAAGLHFLHLHHTLANLRLHKDCKTISGNFEVQKKYQKVRSSIVFPYSLHSRNRLVDNSYHLVLKSAMRVKGMLRNLTENKRIILWRTRKVMERVRAE